METDGMYGDGDDRETVETVEGSILEACSATVVSVVSVVLVVPRCCVETVLLLFSVSSTGEILATEYAGTYIGDKRTNILLQGQGQGQGRTCTIDLCLIVPTVVFLALHNSILTHQRIDVHHFRISNHHRASLQILAQLKNPSHTRHSPAALPARSAALGVMCVPSREVRYMWCG